MFILSLVHANELVPPVASEVNVMSAEYEPVHITWLLAAEAFGVGLTVTAAVAVAPTQSRPANVNVGVTVILPEIGDVLPLVPVKLNMPLPDPLPARPIAVLSLDHANVLVPPVASELNVMSVVDVPLHTI